MQYLLNEELRTSLAIILFLCYTQVLQGLQFLLLLLFALGLIFSLL